MNEKEKIGLLKEFILDIFLALLSYIELPYNL